MKYINFKSIALVLVVFMLSACDNEEFFDLTNPVESPWLSLEDFEKSAIGAYYTLTGNGGNRSIFGTGRMNAEAYADGMQLASANEGFNVNTDIEDMYNRATSGTVIGLFDNPVWRSGYFAVGHANAALDHIANNDGVPYPEAGPDATNRLEGELRFVRAYAYYYIARVYAPAYPSDEQRLPFRVNQARNFEEAKASDVASANDIYALIVEDLKQAKDLLPERFDADLHPAAYADGRANKFSAAALLAKVYFQMGEYDLARAELDFVIDQNGGDYDLSEDPVETWNKTGVARGKEVLWYYAAWAGDGLGGSSNWKHPGRFSWYNANNRDASGADKNGGRFMAASDAFLQTVGWADENMNETAEALQDKRYTQLWARFEAGGDPRSQFATGKPYVWCDKYYKAGRRITNVPLIRLADMYLLRAIIRAELGSSTDLAGARADLDAVRTRAGLAAFAGTDAELPNAIHVERFKEMAFEGDRLYYLQGARMSIPAGDRGGAEVPWDSPFYSDIPAFEIELNDGLGG
ncbi:MAG: RagB/SusD family nutrient uptake outer membrane protein [Saprospiraceae bacterium]|nr:RagB/SusD family nutrient uptake outer membrane protein [Saprospiraceae bacterium]